MKKAQVEHNGEQLEVSVTSDGLLSTADGLTLPAEEVRWLPTPHQAVICVALNYASHVAELEASFHEAPHNKPPEQPILFVKPENTLTGHLCPVQCPDEAESIQAGPGLAVVIGKTARRIKAANAFEHIAGYTLFNDFSLPETSYFRPPVRDKCFDSFGPLGPFVVDAADVSDPHKLAIRTYVNGDLKQQGNTNDLIRNIPTLLETITHYMTMSPGFILVTGFPAGRVSASAGDQIDIEIDEIGTLSNRVVSQAEYFAEVAA